MVRSLAPSGVFYPPMSPNVIPIAIGFAVFLLAFGAEIWHLRRCRTVARLAFGPAAAARPWTRAIPIVGALACGVLAWGLVVLAILPPESPQNAGTNSSDPSAAEEWQRIIILLDVSPSMNITDAGEKKDKRRRDRILEVADGICSRIALGRTRFSVVAFFTSARPVVVDTTDVAVIRNVLDNLPLIWSFKPGETQLLEGVRAAAELARDWPPESTTLLICTDGDTADFNRIPQLPRSIHKVDILAVGDPLVGTAINHHDSRQQAGILRRLAAELHGSYYDVNTRHVPTSALTELAHVPPQPAKLGLGIKDIALILVALGAIVLTCIPIALEYAGSHWHTENELPSVSVQDTVPSQRQPTSSATRELVG
jgi:Ca-activated chloride channel family protein